MRNSHYKMVIQSPQVCGEAFVVLNDGAFTGLRGTVYYEGLFRRYGKYIAARLSSSGHAPIYLRGHAESDTATLKGKSNCASAPEIAIGLIRISD